MGFFYFKRTSPNHGILGGKGEPIIHGATRSAQIVFLNDHGYMVTNLSVGPDGSPLRHTNIANESSLPRSHKTLGAGTLARKRTRFQTRKDPHENRAGDRSVQASLACKLAMFHARKEPHENRAGDRSVQASLTRKLAMFHVRKEPHENRAGDRSVLASLAR